MLPLSTMVEVPLDLVKRLKRDDLSALGDLFELLGKSIYNRSLFMLKNEALASDAVQEILLKAFQRIKTLKEEDKLEAWINRLTYNYCIDHFRKEKKLNETSISAVENSEEFSFDLIDEIDRLQGLEELKEELSTHIEALKEVDRTVLMMYYWENYSVNEIAEIMQLSPSAVKMKLSRTREQLKTRLEKAGFTHALELGVLLLLQLL